MSPDDPAADPSGPRASLISADHTPAHQRQSAAHARKAHTAVITLRGDPEWKHQAEKLAVLGAAGRNPWETPTDVLKWCLSTGLRLAARVGADQDAGALEAYQDAVTHAEEARAEIAKARRLHDLVTQTMADYLSMGLVDAAVHFLHHQIDRLTHMAATGPRDWLLAELARQYDQYLIQPIHPATFGHPAPTVARMKRTARRKRRRGTVVPITPEG